MRQHSPHLLFEDGRLTQPASHCEVEQFVVWNAAPQKKGQTRSEFQIADAVRPIGSSIRGIPLDPDQELRTRQDRPKRHFNTGIEIPLLPRILIERERHSDVFISHRPAICAARKSRDDGSGTAIFFRGSCWTADKNSFPARRIAGTRCVKWPGDSYGIDRGLNSGMPVHVEVSRIGLALRFDQRARLGDESDRNSMRTSLNWNVKFQVAVDIFVSVIGTSRDARSLRPDGEECHPLAVNRALYLVGFSKAFDIFVPVAHQSNLDLVFRIYRKRVMHHGPTPGS